MNEERDYPEYAYPPRVPISFKALLDRPGRPLIEREQAELDRITAETAALLIKVEAILAEVDATCPIISGGLQRPE